MGTEGAGPDRVAEPTAGAGPGPDPSDGSPSDVNRVGRLAENTLLRTVTPNVLRELEGRCRWRELDTNDVVFDQDDASQDVFFIVRGKLRIVVFRGPADEDGAGGAAGPGAAETRSDAENDDDAPAATDDQRTEDRAAESESMKAGLAAFEELMEGGAPMTLTELGAGDTFGELSAIDGRMRSARAVALEPSVVAIMDGPDFLELVRSEGDLAIALLRRVSGYLRTSNRRMYNLSTLTAKQRVFAQLSRLAEVNPTRPTEWVIDPLPSHVDIAFWAGTKRETVAAAIGWLAKEGIVARQHRALLVREPGRLRSLANG
jgi:CRP-like cAMP-binding protein